MASAFEDPIGAVEAGVTVIVFSGLGGDVRPLVLVLGLAAG